MHRTLAVMLIAALLTFDVNARLAPQVDAALQAKLERLVEGFRGDVGLYVRHLKTDRTAVLNADTLFPTASLIKVPILLKTFDSVEKGTLDYRQKLVYRDSSCTPEKTSSGPFATAQRSRSTSDNTADLWLQHLCGTGSAINTWLAGHGYSQTRVNARTPGREAQRARYGWGQTMPREIAELL